MASASGTVCCVTYPSCCPAQPSGTLCCPPTALCAVPPITISVKPDPAMAGAPVTITGTVTGGNGVTATLWQRAAGATTFSQASTTTTSSAGAYEFTRPPDSVMSDTGFYVTSGTSQSVTVDELVTARVSVVPPTGGAVLDRPVTIAGAVSPAQPGAQVLLLQRRGRDWNVVGGGRLSGASAFLIRHRFRHVGRPRLEVELPANARYAQSFSPAFAVPVRPGT